MQHHADISFNGRQRMPGGGNLKSRIANAPGNTGLHPGASVAVIVLTFNEESNLDACLDSVKGWAAEVIVVDSYSTDRTVDIALAREPDGVRVVQHRFENYGAQWTWAVTHLPIASEWVLKLDADERVTPEFMAEVTETTANAEAETDGFYFHRRFVFMGERLRWSGRLPYDLRLWRRGKARLENRSVNEHIFVDGKQGYLRSAVLHFDHKSLSDWIEKHNRYSSLEALNAIRGDITGNVQPRLFGSPPERRMWFKLAYQTIPTGPVAYFLFLYLIRLGVLDGAAGFAYCSLRAQYLFWTELKLKEYTRRRVAPEVLWPARGQPHPRVAASDLQRHCDQT